MQRAALVLLAVVTASASGAAQPAPVPQVSGSYVYRAYCASCHGPDGRGDGPLAEDLRYRPSNLTLIAKRNGGEFPTELVVRIVDGRKSVKGHEGKCGGTKVDEIKDEAACSAAGGAWTTEADAEKYKKKM